MSTLTRATAYTVRIAAVTAATPVLAGAAAASATAKLAGKPGATLTAGASAPEQLVQGVVQWLNRLGPVEISTLDGPNESVEFRLPVQLARA